MNYICQEGFQFVFEIIPNNYGFNIVVIVCSEKKDRDRRTWYWWKSFNNKETGRTGRGR